MQLADEEREQIRRVLSRVQGPRDVPRRGAEGGSEEEAEGDLRGHAGQGPLRGLAPQKWKRAAAPMGWRQHGENLGRSTEKTVDKTIGTPPRWHCSQQGTVLTSRNTQPRDSSGRGNSFHLHFQHLKSKGNDEDVH